MDQMRGEQVEQQAPFVQRLADQPKSNISR